MGIVFNRVYRLILKRMLDVILSGFMLVVLCPLFFILCILVRINLGSPILFAQKRPGKKERVFTLYKFRTMTEDTDENGNLLDDERRLTDFGRFLRSTSLDELPELYNIFRGEMSFVGPRPLLEEYLTRYSKEQHRRHEVLPGLTGYAQVCGRNLISWEEKLEKDVWYVDHVSFALDLKIIIKTVFIVLARKGISSETSETMEEFKGSSNTND